MSLSEEELDDVNAELLREVAGAIQAHNWEQEQGLRRAIQILKSVREASFATRSNLRLQRLHKRQQRHEQTLRHPAK